MRGVAYGTKVSPQICNRLVDASRGVLNHFLPDVWARASADTYALRPP